MIRGFFQYLPWVATIFGSYPHPCTVDSMSLLPPDCGTYRGTKHLELPPICSVSNDGRSGFMTPPVLAVAMRLPVIRPARYSRLSGRGFWRTGPIISPSS